MKLMNRRAFKFSMNNLELTVDQLEDIQTMNTMPRANDRALYAAITRIAQGICTLKRRKPVIFARKRQKRFAMIVGMLLAIGASALMAWLMPTPDINLNRYHDTDKKMSETFQNLDKFNTALIKHERVQDERLTKLEKSQYIMTLIEDMKEARNNFLFRPEQIATSAVEDLLDELVSRNLLDHRALISVIEVLRPVISVSVGLGRKDDSTLCGSTYLLARVLLPTPGMQTYKAFEKLKS